MNQIRTSGRSVLVDANGLRHRVLWYGETGGRDLLVLPSITSPAVTADFIAVRLAELGYRVAVPDARGRGGNDRAPAGAYRLTDYAADVAGLVHVLGLREPVIVGHSKGARTAVLESDEGLGNEDFFEYWARVTPPAVLVRGADSRIVPTTAVDELQAANPRHRDPRRLRGRTHGPVGQPDRLPGLRPAASARPTQHHVHRLIGGT